MAWRIVQVGLSDINSLWLKNRKIAPVAVAYGIRAIVIPHVAVRQGWSMLILTLLTRPVWRSGHVMAHLDNRAGHI